MLIIGFNGQARVGKDTAADYLVKNYGFLKISLADPIKRYARDMFGLKNEQLWGDLKDVPDPRFPRICAHECKDIDKCDICGVLPDCFMPREFVQFLGTEFGRRFYPNIWLDQTFNTIDQIIDNSYYSYISDVGAYHSGRLNKYDAIAIPDIRFANELDYLGDNGVVLYRVRRPGLLVNNQVSKHSSELEQLSIPDSRFRSVLENDSSIEDYYDKVEALYQDIYSR